MLATAKQQQHSAPGFNQDHYHAEKKGSRQYERASSQWL
jgi:hypothetical protein